MRFYKIIIEKELNVRLIEAPVWCPIGRILRRCWIVHSVTSAREWKCGRIHLRRVWGVGRVCDDPLCCLPEGLCFHVTLKGCLWPLPLLSVSINWPCWLLLTPGHHSWSLGAHLHTYTCIRLLYLFDVFRCWLLKSGLNNDTDNYLTKSIHLSFQACAVLLLKNICWSCTSIFMAQLEILLICHQDTVIWLTWLTKLKDSKNVWKWQINK